jgi:hypothetical protein
MHIHGVDIATVATVGLHGERATGYCTDSTDLEHYRATTTTAAGPISASSTGNASIGAYRYSATRTGGTSSNGIGPDKHDATPVGAGTGRAVVLLTTTTASTHIYSCGKTIAKQGYATKAPGCSSDSTTNTCPAFAAAGKVGTSPTPGIVVAAAASAINYPGAAIGICSVGA